MRKHPVLLISNNLSNTGRDFTGGKPLDSEFLLKQPR
jgi:hypothetical protein